MNATIIVSCLLTLPTFIRKCRNWASKAYGSMKSHSSASKSMHKLPDHEHEFKHVSDQERTALKPPKDPYPMVTLTDITLMSQAPTTTTHSDIHSDSMELKSRQDSVDQPESQRSVEHRV